LLFCEVSLYLRCQSPTSAGPALVLDVLRADFSS
jgi:hypothetical protein